MKREVEITLKGHITLSGEKVLYTLDDDAFRLLGKALELMHLTKGDRTAVGVMLEAHYSMGGLILKGFVDAALAMYLDITNFVVLSVLKEPPYKYKPPKNYLK